MVLLIRTRDVSKISICIEDGEKKSLTTPVEVPNVCMSQGDNERKYGSRLRLRIFVPWMGPVGHQVPGTMLRAYLDSTPSMKILLLSGCMITSCLPRSYLWKICYFP